MRILHAFSLIISMILFEMKIRSISTIIFNSKIIYSYYSYLGHYCPDLMAVVYDWILFCSTYYNMRSLQTGYSSYWRRDLSGRGRTQRAVKRQAKENSDIDQGHEARTTEIYTTPAEKALVNLLHLLFKITK